MPTPTSELTPSQQPQPTSTTQTYDFDRYKVPAFINLVLALPFAGLHIADYQNATARVWAIRNEYLIDDGPPTVREFAYRTPALAFAAPIVPLLQTDKALSIDPWSTDPTKNPLVAAFNTIFNQDIANRSVSVATLYGYDLVPGTVTTDPIETMLRVKLMPQSPFQSSTPQTIFDAVNGWFTNDSPVEDSAEWVFDIGMYSAVDPALPRPILRLRRVTSAL